MNEFFYCFLSRRKFSKEHVLEIVILNELLIGPIDLILLPVSKRIPLNKHGLGWTVVVCIYLFQHIALNLTLDLNFQLRRHNRTISGNKEQFILKCIVIYV